MWISQTLNKACLKDYYPLSQTDKLVNNTCRHEFLSFMDAYSSYNQIKMRKTSKEKISCIMATGTYCYTVITYDLKNARATYQRLINHIFCDQIGRNMRVYIDNMLVKSKQTISHIENLAKIFKTSRKARKSQNYDINSKLYEIMKY